eukprot:125076_1
MKPIKINKTKSKISLKKSKFYLKEVFSNMIESPDKMYDKLKRMLNKNSDTLHAFIELGGLSKIYEWLNKFYTNNDENQIIKWLEILNHDNFPIDTELIRNIGLGNFINKYLSKSHSTLTNSIQQKWYNFAKAESEQHSKRQLQSNKKVSIDITQQQVIFKRTDKPSSITNKKHKLKNKHNCKQINSILKNGKMNSKIRNNIKILNDIYNLDDEQHKDIDKDINSENKNKNVDGDILEYVDIDDDDIAMCDSQNTDNDDDDDDDDIDIFDGNNNNNNDINDIKVQIQWSLPMKMKIDCQLKINTNFKGMKEEEERIKKIKYNNSNQCIELVSSRVINKEMNNRHMEVQMLTDYPHWSEIKKYRKENDE